MTSTKTAKIGIGTKDSQTKTKPTATETVSNICHVCNHSATVVPIERLPNNGIVMKATHSDVNMTTHSWAEYKSFWDVGQRKPRSPTRIKCPKCGKLGRINEYKPDIRKKPEIVTYFVVHEKLKGIWGKDKTVARLRRCYIRDPEQRDIVLKKLGRYIPA